MKNKEFIRDYYNRILGSIETDELGNKLIRDRYNKLLGKYDKRTNTTRDFYNRILGKGDLSASLLRIN